MSMSQEQVYGFLKKNKGKKYSASEITSGLNKIGVNITQNCVSANLKRMKLKKKVVMNGVLKQVYWV